MHSKLIVFNFCLILYPENVFDRRISNSAFKAVRILVEKRSLQLLAFLGQSIFDIANLETFST